MEQPIEVIQALLSKLSLYIGEYLLLVAGMGIILLLVLILVISRRRRKRFSSSGDGDVEFLEVGPEPVIVYRRAAEQEQEKEPEPGQKTPPLPTPEPQPEPEQEQEPEEQQDEPRPELPGPELEDEPLPEPVLDPEPLPDDTEPESNDPVPEPESKATLNLQPLPYLESELANNTLNLFSQQGFTIEEIVYQGIFGGDFIAVRPGVRAYVQVKDWKKKITANSVAEVNSYANTHDCNQAVIVTAVSFNRSAAKAAARLNVSLWNKKILKNLQKKSILPQMEDAVAEKD